MKDIEDTIMSVHYVNGRFFGYIYSGTGVNVSCEIDRRTLDHLKNTVDRAIADNECEREAQAVSQAQAESTPTVAEIRGDLTP